jgi:hypothetical protein
VRTARASIVCIAVAGTLAVTSSRADVSGDCIAAAEQAQPLQHNGKFRAALDRLHACTRPQCPALIRSDCTKWLAEVEATMPTIVVHATDQAGADLTDVRVLVDGELVASSVDGRDIPIDSGPHVLRFERAGSDAVEQRLVADVGAQHRLVSVTLSATAAPQHLAATAATSEAQAPSPGAEHGPRRSMVVPLVFGGVGVVAAAVGGVLWGIGLSQCPSNLESSGSSCTQHQLDGAHASLVAGDVLVSVGGAAIVAGLILWLVGAGSASPPPVSAQSDGLLHF